MLLGFNLKELFGFPFQNSESKKYFLMGCLVYLAGFFIPIIPGLIVMGYSAIIIRQVLNGEKPHLVPWENWEALLKDGARLFGIRFIYSSPMFLLMVPLILIAFGFPLLSTFAANNDSQSIGMASILFAMVMFGISILTLPLSLTIGLIVPAAEVHVVDRDEFMAGLRPKEWWPIFKKNWSGFAVALVVAYGIMMIMSFAMQIMIFTIVLLCLFPLLIPPVSMYYTIIHYVVFAQAYKDGKGSLKTDLSISQ